MAEILGQVDPAPTMDLSTLIEARAAMLVEYQSAAYAARYRSMIEEVQARESAVTGRTGALSRAAAEGLFRLMAYKDEYEVARLHAASNYAPGVVFHMSPPLIARVDQRTGRRSKVAIPGWLALPLFCLLRRGKLFRGTALDPFGYQAERKAERALIEQYIADLRTALATLQPRRWRRSSNVRVVAGHDLRLWFSEGQRTRESSGRVATGGIAAGGSCSANGGDGGTIGLPSPDIMRRTAAISGSPLMKIAASGSRWHDRVHRVTIPIHHMDRPPVSMS